VVRNPANHGLSDAAIEAMWANQRPQMRDHAGRGRLWTALLFLVVVSIIPIGMIFTGRDTQVLHFTLWGMWLTVFVLVFAGIIASFPQKPARGFLLVAVELLYLGLAGLFMAMN